MDDARQILSETGAPVVVFDKVQLAFDEKVVLKDVSFTVHTGDFGGRCARLNADGKADSAARARHADCCHGIPRNF